MLYKNKCEFIEFNIPFQAKVLDVGFLGQGIKSTDPNWPHRLLTRGFGGGETWGVDIVDFEEKYYPKPYYQKASAEDFQFDTEFDVIFAGDLIEHLSNPGLFLQRCKEHLSWKGKLILTTPNVFNLFNIIEKLTKREPTVNSDHTVYYNSKTLAQLLYKNGLKITSIDYIYTLGYNHQESWKKKILNTIYWFLCKITDKYAETLVVTACL